MINTYNVKQAQLRNGSYKVGTGKETILIVGSCRSVMYLNYLNWWNESNGNRFTIHHFDPFNWSFDPATDKIIDLESKIETLERDETILNLLRSTDIYIHEYYQHFGMFNSDRNREKNIYQFGLNPKLEICIPNFNDLFILFNDQLTFDQEMKTLAKNDLTNHGGLTTETQAIMKAKGEVAIQKFYDICALSSIPEMADYFKEHHKTTRLFHTYNHVSREFNIAIFELINRKFLALEISDNLWKFFYSQPDMFASPNTGLTKYDVDNFGFSWNEPLRDLMV